MLLFCIVGKKNFMDFFLCMFVNFQVGCFFFIYQVDNIKFIYCDVWGKVWFMLCLGGEVWDQNIFICLIFGFGIQLGLILFFLIVCLLFFINYGGDEVNGFFCCLICFCFLFFCMYDKISVGWLFYGIVGDWYYYIQCDFIGRMYCLMSCVLEVDGFFDYFNYLLQICVDGVLFGIVG